MLKWCKQVIIPYHILLKWLKYLDKHCIIGKRIVLSHKKNNFAHGFECSPIKKNTSFCCFNSRLSRLLQEHGKKQLKLSFGSAEKPECRGFTPQELSQLDFSKMDLSELFEDIQKNFKPQSAESITGSISLKNLQQNMNNLTSGKK